MNTYGEIKKQVEEKNSILFKECEVFFAFSDKQFNENKTPLKEDDKYVTFIGGGYLPKSNVEKLKEGMANTNSWEREQIKANNLQETEIAYELNNHECYYTGEIDEVVDLFEGIYTVEEIKEVYYKHLNNN